MGFCALQKLFIIIIIIIHLRVIGRISKFMSNTTVDDWSFDFYSNGTKWEAHSHCDKKKPYTCKS